MFTFRKIFLFLGIIPTLLQPVLVLAAEPASPHQERTALTNLFKLLPPSLSADEAEREMIRLFLENGERFEQIPDLMNVTAHKAAVIAGMCHRIIGLIREKYVVNDWERLCAAYRAGLDDPSKRDSMPWANPPSFLEEIRKKRDPLAIGLWANVMLQRLDKTEQTSIREFWPADFFKISVQEFINLTSKLSRQSWDDRSVNMLRIRDLLAVACKKNKEIAVLEMRDILDPDSAPSEEYWLERAEVHQVLKYLIQHTIDEARSSFQEAREKEERDALAALAEKINHNVEEVNAIWEGLPRRALKYYNNRFAALSAANPSIDHADHERQALQDTHKAYGVRSTTGATFCAAGAVLHSPFSFSLELWEQCISGKTE